MQEAIASFDPQVFTCLDDVVTVQKCLPTEEEQGLLESYVSSGASLDLLTDEEKFCILLMKVETSSTHARAYNESALPSNLMNRNQHRDSFVQIPRVHSRLATFKVKFEAQLLLAESHATLQNHLQAQAELRSSACFEAVLKETLAHGVSLSLLFAQLTSYLRAILKGDLG